MHQTLPDFKKEKLTLSAYNLLEAKKSLVEKQESLNGGCCSYNAAGCIVGPDLAVIHLATLLELCNHPEIKQGRCNALKGQSLLYD